MKKTIVLLMLSSTVLLAFDGEKVYQNCAMCHGEDATKIIHKSSARLSAFSAEELSMKLNGMLDGSSNIPKQYLNLHQAKLKIAGISKENTGELSHYILNLK